MESSWKGKTVLVLCALSFLSLIYVAFRLMKTNTPPSQDPHSLKGRVAKPEAPVEQDRSSISSSQENQSIPGLPGEILELYIFPHLNAEELAKIALVCQLWKALAFSEPLSYAIPFPSWLKNIEADSLKEKDIDLTKYGLDFTGALRINRRGLTKGLKPLSKRVENNRGITNLIRPKNLTLNIVLQIAKDYSVPIGYIWPEIITAFGNIPAEKTCVLFFTNSIFTGTRNRTPDQHEVDIKTIGKECEISIQMHNVRDFMWFLVLTYLDSPEDARTLLYSSATYTRLLEKMYNWSLYGGFAPSGLFAFHDSPFGNDGIGVGASGSSEDIGTRNIGT